VILTVQPRPAAASLSFTEIPAGMLDGQSFAGAAANEIKEEASLTISEHELINMSKEALKDQPASEEVLEDAMYPSAGACDEFIPLMLCQKKVTRQYMEELKGKATGLRDEGEKIKLKLVPLERAWKEGGRDAKCLAALALYEGLKKEGKVSEMEPEKLE
jgi:ADP-sugar diphosphatase